MSHMSHVPFLEHDLLQNAQRIREPLYNGWELTCGARCGLRLQLRCCCWLMKPQNRLALDLKCTFSLLKTQRGAPSGLATGYTVAHNCGCVLLRVMKLSRERSFSITFEF